MAAHYDTAILPARPRRPRDKAKIEVAVLIFEAEQAIMLFAGEVSVDSGVGKHLFSVTALR